jgi:hypothetical protein
MVGPCRTHGLCKKYAQIFFLRKPEGKRPLGIPTCRYDNDIKMDITKIGCQNKDWIHKSQGRALVKTIM